MRQESVKVILYLLQATATVTGGRDALDMVYAKALGAEDALVRHNFVSGTHALTVALFGVLRPGDTMLSVTGIPYDTLRGVIGMTGDANGSLKEFGIHYKEVQLKADGTPDYQAIEQAIEPNQKNGIYPALERIQPKAIFIDRRYRKNCGNC